MSNLVNIKAWELHHKVSLESIHELLPTRRVVYVKDLNWHRLGLSIQIDPLNRQSLTALFQGVYQHDKVVQFLSRTSNNKRFFFPSGNLDYYKVLRYI